MENPVILKASIYNYSGNVVYSEDIEFKRFIFMKFLNKAIKSGLTLEEIDISRTLKEMNKNKGLMIKSVLVSDDEEILRDAYLDTLTRLCHYVEVYPTADEAFSVFAEEPDRYDVILTDNVMPESKLTGSAYAKKAKGISSKVKVHVITGEISSVDNDIFDHNVDNALSKPLNEYTFAMTIGKGKVTPQKSAAIIDFQERKRERELKEKEDSDYIENV